MITITSAESTGLWHAVQALADVVRAMRTMDFTPEQVAVEEARLTAAKRALRKVHAMRREARKAGAA